jgi:putative DNA primase/helicase
MSRVRGKKNDAGDVRASLEPLKRLAEDHHCAVIGIHHVRKGKIDDPSDALLGSTAFRDVPRAGFVMLKDPHDEHTILLVHEKCNLAKQQATLRLQFSERAVTDGDVDLGLVGRIDVLGEDEPKQ